MKHTLLKQQIKGLRQDNAQRMLETVVVFIAAFMATAYLPSLLIRYYYANQQLTAQPPILDMIPVFSFAVSVAFLLYAIISNVYSSMKVMRLEKELETMSDSCCGGCCGDSCVCSSDEMPSMSELENLVNNALTEAEMMDGKKTTKTAKKKSSTKKK